MDTDRQIAAAILIVHAALIGVAVVFNTLMILNLGLHGIMVWVDSHDPLVVGIYGAIGGLQGLITLATVLTATFELLAAIRAFRGEGRSLRTAAPLGVALSMGMVPASVLSCSFCSAMYWPLLILVGIPALVFAQRARR